MQMSYNNTLNVSIQQIQIFLKAVELKNFTKVAAFFSFTPSAVSKNIQSLEEELGLQLFVRKPHELTPTPAAQILAQDWRQLGDSVIYSIAKARACQNAEESTIKLGFVDSSDSMDKNVTQAISEYNRKHPKIVIYAEKHDMHRANELLNMGMLDIAITSMIENVYLDSRNLPWEKIVDTDVVAFVPAGNKLFQRDTITFNDIRSQRLLSLDHTMHPSYDKWLYELCNEHGFSPNINATFRTVRSLLFNLNIMDNIFIGETITAGWCNEKLKAFPLGSKSFTNIAWRDGCNDNVIDFKNFIRDYLKGVE